MQACVYASRNDAIVVAVLVDRDGWVLARGKVKERDGKERNY
jgi:hypothetical protein